MKRRDTVLTIILWMLYAYLCMPGVSLLAWYVGIDFAYDMVEEAGGPEELLRLLASFGTVLAVVACLVVGWSLSQYWRFHDKNRRTAAPRPDAEAEMALWNISAAQHAQVRNGKNIILAIDENLVLTSVRDVPRPTGTPPEGDESDPLSGPLSGEPSDETGGGAPDAG
jgi:poly-beta-1,6-N-acetyl-D-glucosamine biosynthesis protein PgaD